MSQNRDMGHPEFKNWRDVGRPANQALYDAARNHPDAPESKAVQWWMANRGHLPGGAYILFPGTEAKPW